MSLYSWGMYPKVRSKILKFYDNDTLKGDLETGSLIPYGNGRSYGDSALGDVMLDMRDHDHFISFDEKQGLLEIESGVLLSEIIEAFVPRGWFLKVTPGTKLITVGGAIASDIHGKNHHQEGCFSECVKSFKIMLANGEIKEVSKDKNKELFLSFQPQHLFESNKLVSAEVLLRWDSKEFGLVSPDEFIPIAEESGLIIEIGEWVFRQSCKAVRAFKGIYPELKHIAVNVSSEQFNSYDIISKFPAMVEEQGILTSDIEIELTERSVMEQTESGNNILLKLRSLGFKISVDDFGTGYSSMSYLKSLPIDVVKVDKSFIDGLPHDEGDTVIVKAILALIQNLGYETVAEGVEYKEQAKMLRELGCDIAQGYLFSKPLTYSDFIDYIEDAMKRTR